MTCNPKHQVASVRSTLNFPFVWSAWHPEWKVSTIIFLTLSFNWTPYIYIFCVQIDLKYRFNLWKCEIGTFKIHTLGCVTVVIVTNSLVKLNKHVVDIASGRPCSLDSNGTVIRSSLHTNRVSRERWFEWAAFDFGDSFEILKSLALK